MTTKGKIKKHLEFKKKRYDNFDRILEMYLSGEIQKLLYKYADIAIDSTFNKDSKTIQLNYRFNNINVIVDFYENNYNIVIYPLGIAIDDFEKLFVDYGYQEEFDLEKLIKEIDLKIRTHPELKDTTLSEKKKRIYSLIAWICWCAPIVICGSIATFGFIFEKTIKGDIWWGIFFIASPLIIGCIFDIISKRVE